MNAILPILGDSLEEFKWLLYATSTSSINSTVTIWGTDHLSNEQHEKLLTFIDVIGRDRTYTDTTADTNPETFNSISGQTSSHKVPLTKAYN